MGVIITIARLRKVSLFWITSQYNKYCRLFWTPLTTSIQETFIQYFLEIQDFLENIVLPVSKTEILTMGES